VTDLGDSTLPIFFLCIAVVGVLLTANAFAAQRRSGPLVILSFFAGWLVSELPLHTLAIQVLGTLFFASAGALDAWPGQLGLALTFVSWGGLLALVPVARQARNVVEASLVDALGADYRDRWMPDVERASQTPPLAGRQLRVFKMRHPQVEVIRDVPYLEDQNPKHMLDLYLPRNRKVGARPAPVLLQIHGGGWIIGNKREQALPLMNLMAARGWVCVAINYRLSPKATFPDHLLDAKCALKWIRETIHEYAGDPDFVVATGGSAGGHLCSLLSLTANDPEYQPGFETLDTSVSGCVPFYGIYDFANRYDLQAQEGLLDVLEKKVMKKKLEVDLEDFVRASPMHRIHSDAPPMYVIHGDQDSLASVEEARKFVELMRAGSRSPVAYAEIPGAQHAFEIFHSPRCSTVVESVSRFLTTLYCDHLRLTSGVKSALPPSASG